MIEVKEFEECFNVLYEGQGVSLNKFYSQGHWSVRNNIKNKYKPIITLLLKEAKVPKMDEFGLVIEYNSRHDPDNVTGMEKLFVDSMKENGLIIDDHKKYYKFYCVTPNLELANNTFIFKIYKIK